MSAVESAIFITKENIPIDAICGMLQSAIHHNEESISCFKAIFDILEASESGNSENLVIEKTQGKRPEGKMC